MGLGARKQKIPPNNTYLNIRTHRLSLSTQTLLQYVVCLSVCNCIRVCVCEKGKEKERVNELTVTLSKQGYKLRASSVCYAVNWPTNGQVTRQK